MIRKIVVQAEEVTIEATIRTNGSFSRNEVERVRDALADRLQAACAGLPYGVGCVINRVKVR